MKYSDIAFEKGVASFQNYAFKEFSISFPPM